MCRGAGHNTTRSAGRVLRVLALTHHCLHNCQNPLEHSWLAVLAFPAPLSLFVPTVHPPVCTLSSSSLLTDVRHHTETVGHA